jgi:hypothetical protein
LSGKITGYLLLIATTGSSRAAAEAGIIPARMPMAIQINIARDKMPGDINMGK